MNLRVMMPDNDYVLLIDDSEPEAKMIERIVSKSKSGISFKWIQDAETALEQLLEGLPTGCRLILLDIKMPKLTGLELLKILQEKSDLSKHPPIIVYSSSNLERDSNVAHSFAGVTFKTKPDGYLEGKRWLNPILQNINQDRQVK